MRTHFLIILLFFSFSAFSQEIKVSNFKSEPLDISARENKVLDANGDACAIIKTRTGLKNLKFSSDLEIKKIEVREGEYWLWVSPGTKKLIIEADQFPKTEYVLPQYASEYNVYIVFLAIVLPEKVVYNDVSSILFNSKPKKADVYVNDIFYGKTPLKVNITSDVYNYKIQKESFLTVNSSDSINKDIFVRLDRDPNSKSFFLLANIYYNKYNKAFYGYTFGKLGKTSWYFSQGILVQQNKIEECRNEGVYVETGDPEMPFVFERTCNETYANIFRLNGGITQRVIKNGYLLMGVGINLNEGFNYQEFTGLTCQLGAIYRLNNYIIFNFSGLFNFELYRAQEIYYKVADISFGLGINF